MGNRDYRNHRESRSTMRDWIQWDEQQQGDDGEAPQRSSGLAPRGSRCSRSGSGRRPHPMDNRWTTNPAFWFGPGPPPPPALPTINPLPWLGAPPPSSPWPWGPPPPRPDSDSPPAHSPAEAPRGQFTTPPPTACRPASPGTRAGWSPPLSPCPTMAGRGQGQGMETLLCTGRLLRMGWPPSGASPSPLPDPLPPPLQTCPEDLL